MQAIGIDLGGTKIAGHLFDATGRLIAAERVATPADYDDLVTAVVTLRDRAEIRAGGPVPLGIGAAGLVHPDTGLLTAANHIANGKPLAADLSRALGRPVCLINDCQALALSEATDGAGRGHPTVLALVIGTGLSAAIVADGRLHRGFSGVAGEVGHIAAPAHLVQDYALPILPCGCGQRGCIETLLSGAGLSRIDAVTSAEAGRTPEAVIAARARDPVARRTWEVWCALAADLIRTLTRIHDPDCIVIGGGLSRIPGLADDLAQAAAALQFPGFPLAPILIAAGGDASGARGAALAAIAAAKGD